MQASFFFIKNKELNLQTTCSTYNISLHNKTSRACPDANRVKKYFENTGHQIEIFTDSKVCFACYKCRLQILKNESIVGTDTDLHGIISDLTTSREARSKASTIDESINLAMTHTSVYVGLVLLANESMLLPSIHNLFFDKFKKNCSNCTPQ